MDKEKQAFGVRGPRIVCLCGSTRFPDVFHEVNYRETMRGNIVLTVGVFGNMRDKPAYYRELTEQDKQNLDKLHKYKIDLSDRIIVLNVGGYIGESTRGEIAYANSRGIPVDYLFDIEGES